MPKSAPNPVFIVEGHMEQRFIQDICPGKTVLKLSCNGKDVSISRIASRVKSFINVKRNNYPFVIIFDREGREESCDDLRKSLIEELESRGVDQSKLIIGIADRMMENWMLADSDCIAEVQELKKHPKPCEGEFGERQIRKLIKTYGKTTMGVRMLKKMNPRKVAENSPSFRKLFEQINFECWWTDR